MRDNIHNIENALDLLLSDWHCWASNFRHVVQSSSCAMFSEVKSSRQWQDADEVLDNAKHNSTMKAVDFHVNELEPVQRTVIQIKARNLVTGLSVWTSARLPTDPQARAEILMRAKNTLLARLSAAGVL